MRWTSASSAAATHTGTPGVDVVVILSNIEAVYGFIHGHINLWIPSVVS